MRIRNYLDSSKRCATFEMCITLVDHTHRIILDTWELVHCYYLKRVKSHWPAWQEVTCQNCLDTSFYGFCIEKTWLFRARAIVCCDRYVLGQTCQLRLDASAKTPLSKPFSPSPVSTSSLSTLQVGESRIFSRGTLKSKSNTTDTWS